MLFCEFSLLVSTFQIEVNTCVIYLGEEVSV